MKKTILFIIIGLGIIVSGIGCASVERDDDDGISTTRSTTVISSDL